MSTTTTTSAIRALQAIAFLAERASLDLDDPDVDTDDTDPAARARLQLLDDQALRAVADHACLVEHLGAIAATADTGIQLLSEPPSEGLPHLLRPALDLIRATIGDLDEGSRATSLLVQLEERLEELLETGDADLGLVPPWGTVHVMGRQRYTGLLREVDGDLIEIVTPPLDLPERWELDTSRGWGAAVIRSPAVRTARERRLVGRQAIHSIEALTERDALDDLRDRSSGAESTSSSFAWPTDDATRQVLEEVDASRDPQHPDDLNTHVAWLAHDSGAILAVRQQVTTDTDEFGRPSTRITQLEVVAAYHPGQPWPVHLYGPHTTTPTVVGTLDPTRLGGEPPYAICDALHRLLAATPAELAAVGYRDRTTPIDVLALPARKGSGPTPPEDDPSKGLPGWLSRAAQAEPTARTEGARTEADACANPQPWDRWSCPEGGHYTLTRMVGATWAAIRENTPGRPLPETTGWVPGMKGEDYLGSFPPADEQAEAERASEVTRG